MECYGGNCRFKTKKVCKCLNLIFIHPHFQRSIGFQFTIPYCSNTVSISNASNAFLMQHQQQDIDKLNTICANLSNLDCLNFDCDCDCTTLNMLIGNMLKKCSLVSYITTLSRCQKCAQIFHIFNINQLKWIVFVVSLISKLKCHSSYVFFLRPII